MLLESFEQMVNGHQQNIIKFTNTYHLRNNLELYIATIQAEGDHEAVPRRQESGIWSKGEYICTSRGNKLLPHSLHPDNNRIFNFHRSSKTKSNSSKHKRYFSARQVIHSLTCLSVIQSIPVWFSDILIELQSSRAILKFRRSGFYGWG